MRTNLGKGARALARLARFDGYILGGDQFTAADLAAVVHLPTVSGIAKTVLGEDPLESVQGLSARGHAPVRRHEDARSPQGALFGSGPAAPAH